MYLGGSIRKYLLRLSVVIMILGSLGLGLFRFSEIAKADDPLCGTTITGATAGVVNNVFTLDHDMTCSGHGLIIGANSIIIDGRDPITGNNHTITGDGGINDYGINVVGRNNVTVQNINITNFNTGIQFDSVTGGTIQNSYTNDNINMGIYLVLSSDNDLIGNTANSNSDNTVNSGGAGVNLTFSENNTLTGNTANSNDYGFVISDECINNTLTNNTANSNRLQGINLIGSSNTHLTENTMVGNKYNLNLATNYNQDIDTTNTVQEKKVFYLSGISNQTYDGTVIEGGVGMFWCFSCTNVTVRNANMSNNYYGVYFNNTTTSSVTNVNSSSSYAGIFLTSSSNNEFLNNTVNLNLTGISLNSSDNNSLTENSITMNNEGVLLNSVLLNSSDGNTLTENEVINNMYGIKLISSSTANVLTKNVIKSNTYGVHLASSSGNTIGGASGIDGNTISMNSTEINDDGTNTYSNNQLLHSMKSEMLAFTEVSRTKNAGDVVNFDIDKFDIHGSADNRDTDGLSVPCSAASYTITTSPAEPTFVCAKNGNNLTGHFTVTKTGTYSLNITITDSSNNVTKRRYLFFVNALGSKTQTYYPRVLNPTHGQPTPLLDDSKSLRLTPSIIPELVFCTNWVQESPDEIPDYPLAYLNGIDTYSWYKVGSPGLIGAQRFAGYEIPVDVSLSVPLAADYTWVNRNLSGLNWGMDYPYSWYWLSLKLDGNQNSYPRWITFPSGGGYLPDPATNKSHADFSYTYTTTPSVKSISNTDINILSATSSDGDDASVVLNGTGSTDVVLDGYKRPFKDPETGSVTTTITSETASLAASGLNGEATLDSINMDITPNAGSVVVNIIDWDDTQRQWTESGSGVGSSQHAIGGLRPQNYYTVSNTDGWSYAGWSSASGGFNFNYNGGYSGTETFSIRVTQVPSASVSPPVTTDNTSATPTLSDVSLPAFSTKSVNYGQKNDTVKKLQMILKANGYYPRYLSVTGYYGTVTRLAIRKYQKANYLQINGKIDTATLAYLNYGGKYIFTKTLKSGNRGKEVIILQAKLKKGGYFSKWIATTGYFGSSTKTALKKYQKAHHLTQTGILDNRTRLILK